MSIYKMVVSFVGALSVAVCVSAVIAADWDCWTFTRGLCVESEVCAETVAPVGANIGDFCGTGIDGTAINNKPTLVRNGHKLKLPDEEQNCYFKWECYYALDSLGALICQSGGNVRGIDVFKQGPGESCTSGG